MTQEHESNKPTHREKMEQEFKPDLETLHTTDPEEHMKGPISSWMHHIEKNAAKADTETPPPADGDDDDVAEKSE